MFELGGGGEGAWVDRVQLISGSDRFDHHLTRFRLTSTLDTAPCLAPLPPPPAAGSGPAPSPPPPPGGGGGGDAGGR